MKKLIGATVTAVAGLALTFAGAQTATAGQLPSGGCGAGHSLTTVAGAVEVVDWRFLGGPDEAPEWAEEEISTLVDLNEDGMVCVKNYKPNRGQDKRAGAEDYVITLVSDNRAVGRG